jgi:putative ABC transport system permease protein
MRSIWWTFNATRRQRWASWLALSLLIALAGGIVLAGVSAAQRTSSAFPDFNARYGGDAGVFSPKPPPASITKLRGVHQVFEISTFDNGNVTAGTTFIPNQDIGLLVMPPSGPGNVFRLISGHVPLSPDEVDVGFSLQQQANLHVGSIVTIPLYALSQTLAELQTSSSEYLPPKGGRVSLRVVGVSASILDFPTNSPSYSLIVGPSFEHLYGSRDAQTFFGLDRLAGGSGALPQFTYSVNHITSQLLYAYPIDSTAIAVEAAIHPQVEGWWLFALIAAIAGLALIGQALARQSTVERSSYPTLSAIGLSPAQLFGLGMARALAIGGVGTAGAVGFAVLVSPFTPVGEARAAETATGFVLDAAVLGLGAAAMLLAVLVLALYPAWRASRVRLVVAADNDVRGRRASVLAGAAARSGASASMVIGIRHALERGRGRGSVPVATALLGTVAAVAALVGTSVFGSSLTNLLSTPSLYGQTWQLDLSSLTASQVTTLAHRLASEPSVTHVTYGQAGKLIDVNGVETNVVLIKTAKGAPVFGLSQGTEPTGLGEIDLGSETLRAAHAQVGSLVTVAVIQPNGKTSSGSVRVAGVIAFPPVLSFGALGDGSVMALSAAVQVVCGAGPPSVPCRQSIEQKIESPQNTNWGMAVAFDGSAQGRSLLASLERQYSTHLDVISRPINLVNFGGAINFPLLLGAMLAIFGIATLLHLLLVSVARRRRELALLKVLGFVRRQVSAAVCWQAVTIAIVGLIGGVPLGIALGNVAWRDFATGVGAISVSVVPVGRLVLIGVGVLVVGTLLAVLPAVFASRLRPALALREE